MILFLELDSDNKIIVDPRTYFEREVLDRMLKDGIAIGYDDATQRYHFTVSKKDAVPEPAEVLPPTPKARKKRDVKKPHG